MIARGGGSPELVSLQARGQTNCPFALRARVFLLLEAAYSVGQLSRLDASFGLTLRQRFQQLLTAFARRDSSSAMLQTGVEQILKDFN